ncbi:MAG: cellulase family glycosylhydrolase [Ignavibacteriales bacterium]|nr:MAG: cellulase family glycosylhydrolase [Ignavibacteriales bacterium]
MTSIRNIFPYIILLFLLICRTGLAQSGSFYSVSGKDIITPYGKPVVLKGINLGHWMVPEGYMFRFEKISSPRLIYDFFNILLGESEAQKFWSKFRELYITREDIALIQKAGFNSVRIPFHYKLFVNDQGEMTGPGYALMDSAVSWCREYNLGVVLDMHCAPGGQTGDNIDDSYGYPFLFESPEMQELTIRVWRELASRYAKESIVIGYDLLNEPIAHFFDKDKLNPLLEPLFKRITAAIREVDENHIVFIGGAQWNSNFSVFGPPFDSKSVYTFHKYWTAAGKEVIQDYLDYRDKYNVPLYLGESGENTNEWITEFRKTLESESVSWCFWPYKKLESERGVVTIKVPGNYDQIKKFADGFDVSFAYIRDNKPAQEIINRVLDEYLENLAVKNLIINHEYLKALGLAIDNKN